MIYFPIKSQTKICELFILLNICSFYFSNNFPNVFLRPICIFAYFLYNDCKCLRNDELLIYLLSLDCLHILFQILLSYSFILNIALEIIHVSVYNT